MTRVGIIGAGGMGNVHARQYRKRDDVELGFFDHNGDRAARFASNWGAEPATNVASLLNWADVVDVCLPTPDHTSVALKAIAAGRAVFIEKPLARDLADAVAVVNAADKAGVALMPGHVARFFPEYQVAHRVVSTGGIGVPAAARARRGGGAPSGANGWFMDHRKSGGVLLDLSIHDFDWMRWTLGEVKCLYSRSVATGKQEGADYALTTLTFDSGCIGHVEGTWMDPGGFRTAFEIAGSAGLLSHDSRDNAALRACTFTASGASQEGAPLPDTEGAMAPTEDPYYLELSAFLNAVQTGSAPPVTGLDGLHAMAISLAALDSAATGNVTTPARSF